MTPTRTRFAVLPEGSRLHGQGCLWLRDQDGGYDRVDVRELTMRQAAQWLAQREGRRPCRDCSPGPVLRVA